MLSVEAGHILLSMRIRLSLREMVWILPALALVLVLAHSSLWLPGAGIPWTPIVVLGLILVWCAADRKAVWGAAAALLLILLCTLVARPAVHLWGDGALRLRNLEAGIPIAESARFEPGDALLHEYIVSAGMSPAQSFAVTGTVAGVLYLAGLLLLLRGTPPDKRTRGAFLVLMLTPVWMIFFTGYVESYALLAGILALFTGLVHARRSSLYVSLCALAGASVHLLGVLLVPAAIVYSLERKSRIGTLTALATLPAVVIWLVLTGDAGGIPGLQGLLEPGLVERFGLVIFVAPVMIVMPFMMSERPGTANIVNSAVWLCAFILFPLERGAARDWDLGSVMLIPLFMSLVSISFRNRKLVIAVTAAAVLLAGPRMSAFLDSGISMSRYELSIERSSDPEALEELGISRRSDGRFDEAADLFHRAFELSGNGRHLSQEAEALRLAGRPEKAVPSAILATELRPEVETTWLQLALVARDADDPDLAVIAASGHQELYPESPTLWHIALEAAVPDGEARTAWICAERALASEDTLVTVLINAGTAAAMNGFTALAMERYLLASDMNPGSPLPYYNMGMVMLEIGDNISAAYYMSRALGVDSTFVPAREVLNLLE